MTGRGGGFEDRLAKVAWLLAIDAPERPERALVWLRRAAVALHDREEKSEGIARTHVIPSPAWRAPEQIADDRPSDPQTDAWGFGLLAFRVLTGRPYWRSESNDYPGLSMEVTSGALSPASQRAERQGSNAALPPGFDDWFAQCLSRDRSQRFKSVPAALDALASIFTSTPQPMPRARASKPAAVSKPPPASKPARARTAVAPRAPSIEISPLSIAIAVLLFAGIFVLGTCTGGVFVWLVADDDPEPVVAPPIAPQIPQPWPPPPG